MSVDSTIQDLYLIKARKLVEAGFEYVKYMEGNKLVEAGFEYVTDVEGNKLFRKRK